MSPDPESLRQKTVKELITDEHRRAQRHIAQIRRQHPDVSKDRVAQILLDRFITAATVEGGITGAFGLMGVPLNTLFFTYGQVALIVSVAEAYGVVLTSEGGDEALWTLLGQAHGVEDVLRATPRVIGSLAKVLALRYGIGSLSRAIPLLAAPISARLNRRHMKHTGHLAMQRFGQVVMLS